MGQHLDRLTLSPQFHQRSNSVERVEKKVRLQLHLQRTQVGGRELLLKLQGPHRIMLCAQLVLDDSGNPNYESVDQELDAKPVDVEQERPHHLFSRRTP